MKIHYAESKIRANDVKYGQRCRAGNAVYQRLQVPIGVADPTGHHRIPFVTTEGTMAFLEPDQRVDVFVAATTIHALEPGDVFTLARCTNTNFAGMLWMLLKTGRPEDPEPTVGSRPVVFLTDGNVTQFTRDLEVFVDRGSYHAEKVVDP